jgi:hypothetical protein
MRNLWNKDIMLSYRFFATLRFAQNDKRTILNQQYKKNKLNMNNLMKFLIIIAFAMWFSACVTENPIDQLGADGFYQNTDDINMAVMACYNGLQNAVKQEWTLTEMRSDNARHYNNTSTNVTSRDQYAFDIFRVATTNPVNENYWEAVYHNIANCNTVLKYLNAVSDETLKKQYEGEALFLRAYHYFNLVRLYGPLFIVTERIDMEQANNAERNSIEKVYELLIDDLNKIVENNLLPEKYDAANIGRADIWAAKTLLAKIYLTQKRYSEAQTLLKDVEEHSGYELLNNYADVFSINNEMNAEIIFTIRFKAGGYGLGSPFANYFAPINSFDAVITASGSGYNCPTNDLQNAYAATDRRKDVTLASDWTNPTGGIVYVAYVKKYLSPITVAYDAENDFPVFRFADVLLMLAETENELSGIDAGLPYLNRTRTRAGLPPLTTAEIANRNDFRVALAKERRLEFAYENQRYFDLLRTDELVTTMKNHFNSEQIANPNTNALTMYYTDSRTETFVPEEYRTLQSWQLLLPIPYSVISVAPNATQNPGY